VLIINSVTSLYTAKYREVYKLGFQLTVITQPVCVVLIYLSE